MALGKRFGGALAIATGAVSAETFGWGWSALLDWLWSHVGGAMSWSGENVWGVISIALMVGGLAAMLWPAPRKKPLFLRLANLADHAKTRIGYFREGRPSADDGLALLAKLSAISVTFQKAGFMVPEFDDREPDEIVDTLHRYFTALGPTLRLNHMKEAKELARAFCQQS